MPIANLLQHFQHEVHSIRPSVSSAVSKDALLQCHSVKYADFHACPLGLPFDFVLSHAFSDKITASQLTAGDHITTSRHATVGKGTGTSASVARLPGWDTTTYQGSRISETTTARRWAPACLFGLLSIRFSATRWLTPQLHSVARRYCECGKLGKACIAAWTYMHVWPDRVQTFSATHPLPTQPPK